MKFLKMTPWGKPDDAKAYDNGMVFYSTPSHGGFKVPNELLKTMPIKYRNADGWYEEDCEYAKIILAFPQYFTAKQQESAARTFDRYCDETSPNFWKKEG